MSNNYVGRVDPTDEVWKCSLWTDLLKERYYISSLFCKDKIVLDSCCGVGWGTMEYIIPIARYTIGFDICESAAKTYRASDNYRFMVMDAKSIDLKDDTFDVVLSLDSIEHLTRRDGIQYLLEMKRVCKKDGFIIGTTPLVIDDFLIPMYLEWNKYHKYVYTRRNLDGLLRSYFPWVHIYTLYNKTFPYFLFICRKSTPDNQEGEITRPIKKFVYSRGNDRKIKSYHYCQWSKELLTRGDISNSIKLWIMALYQNPISYIVWKSLGIALLPQPIINMLRKIKQWFR